MPRVHAGNRPRVAVGSGTVRAREVLTLLLISGCLWRSYEDIMEVHLQVLSSMAAKVVATAEGGRRPTSNDVTELMYPVQRARQFTHQYRGRAERESYRRFAAFLDRYQQFAEAIDAARGDAQRWTTVAARLPDERRALVEAADEVRVALAAEK